MIKLNTIKLSELEKARLSDQAMRTLRGGNNCYCGCNWEGKGGSSTAVNDASNFDDGLTSYGGGTESCGCGSASSGARDSAFWRG